jgi:hypothetical protein
MGDVKGRGGIVVSNAVLEAAKRDFASYRVSDKEVHTHLPTKIRFSGTDD